MYVKVKFFVLILASLLSHTIVLAAKDRPIRVAVPAPAAVYLPLWVAKDAGFFKKHQLDVELVYVGSSPVALAALLGDEIDIQSGTRVAVAAYLQGLRDVTIFAALDYALPFAIYARPPIKDVMELRGKRFGVTRIGGDLDFATRYYLNLVGLNPKDVNFFQVGSVPDIVNALRRDSIDAATVSIPFNHVAKKEGFNELADLTRISGLRYALTSFSAKKKLLIVEKERMDGWVKAVIEAIRYTKTFRDESLKILARYTRINDPVILRAAYGQYVDLWPKIPEVKPKDLNLVLEQLGQTNPQALKINPADLIYGSLIENLVQSGFIEQVYR